MQYEAENFIDKNKDTVPDEHLSLLQDAEFDFLKDVLEKAAANNSVPTVKKRIHMYEPMTLFFMFSLKTASV